jgi:hypothetical protein
MKVTPKRSNRLYLNVLNNCLLNKEKEMKAYRPDGNPSKLVHKPSLPQWNKKATTPKSASTANYEKLPQKSQTGQSLSL